MEFNEARNIAVYICRYLKDYCEKVNIAGSVRRGNTIVNDIEIMAIPKSTIIEEKDLFGSVSQVKRIIHPEYAKRVKALGEIKKGTVEGRYMQIYTGWKVTLDLFMPEPHDYFRQYAIRTGNFKYSQYVIAAAWKRKGWVGSDKGLRKISDCRERKNGDGSSTWLCNNPRAQKPPQWQSEEEFFRWIGVRWVEPEYRNM